MTIDAESFWRLKSGRLVKVLKAGAGRIDCVYVDALGRILMPLYRQQVSLSRAFIENYARRVSLDSAASQGTVCL